MLDTGTPSELLRRTGTQSLEAAFIALLPEDKKRGHAAVVIPPLPDRCEDDIAIEARGELTMRFGDFVAVDHVSFRIRRGEIFRLPRLQRLRQDHHDEDADGLLPASEGRGGCSATWSMPATSPRAARGLYVAGVFAVRRADGAAEPGAARPAVRRAGG